MTRDYSAYDEIRHVTTRRERDLAAALAHAVEWAKEACPGQNTRWWENVLADRLHPDPDHCYDCDCPKKDCACASVAICVTCEDIRTKHGGFGPSHEGSKLCESGSIASGGTIAHCSCDTCF